MPTSKVPEYKNRPVQKWLDMAGNGELALPVFQRSYVWNSRKAIEEYLTAIFWNRPTGIFLVLKTAKEPQFKSRTLRGVSFDNDPQANELLLDGQQRLTSLWQAFNDESQFAYYVAVEDLTQENLSVSGVESHSKKTANGKALSDAKTAHGRNLIPLSILQDKKNEKAKHGQVWKWSSAVFENDPDKAMNLKHAINELGKDVLLLRGLWYCELDADTEREAAIDVFINSNKSSVKVNEFDISVALALGAGGENLRERLSSFFQQSSVLKHYVGASDGDDERIITRLGEWLLFSACITQKNTAPKRRLYEDVIRQIVSDQGQTDIRLNGLLKNIERGLFALAERGVPTGDTLPSLPALHVVAALQDDLRQVTKANPMGVCEKLVTAYLWRAFFSDRYEGQANERLFEDFIGLRNCIAIIRDDGILQDADLPPIFDKQLHKLPNATAFGLKKDVPWIKSASRMGRSIGALSLHLVPVDWLTNKALNTMAVRELASSGKMDRHHVFPKSLLTAEDVGFSTKEANHGLNGVLLSKPANQALSGKDPKDYMKWALDSQNSLTKTELAERVESHLVPYDIIMSDAPLKERYKMFIRERARRFAGKIEELSAPPVHNDPWQALDANQSHLS